MNFDRRMLMLTGLALAGCQTTGMSQTAPRLLSGKYDGKYDIVIGRLWNPTPQNIRNPYYKTEPETLAYLNARVADGHFTLTRVDDKSVGPNYKDFTASFYEGGILELSTTVGYLVGVSSPYKLRVSLNLGEKLLSGKWVAFEPKGFDADFRAHINMRKVG